MAFHPAVLLAAQQEVLRTAGPFATGAGFYLAGGTALAIQLGHRRSVDLDWLTPDAIADPMRFASEVRAAIADFAMTSTDAGTLHGEVGGVKLSFLEYRYPLLVPPVEWSDFACRLAGLEDLACMKLAATGGRGLKKDFIDIYALGRTGFSLDDMLALYRRKYRTEDVGHILMSLTYFDDAEPEDMPEMLWKVNWPDVKRTIEAWVSETVRRQAPTMTPGSTRERGEQL